jgi:hypothetical protein
MPKGYTQAFSRFYSIARFPKTAIEYTKALVS